MATENIINNTTKGYAYDAFKENAVNDVTSVEEFLKRYYKKDRYEGRGPEYAQLILANCKKEFEEQGVTYMSRFESITGEVVSFYKRSE